MTTCEEGGVPKRLLVLLGLGYGKTLREGREVSLNLAKYERWVQY